MKEFQALGLDVSFIDDQGESHQLKDIEDEEDKEDNGLTIEDIESPVTKVEEEQAVEEENELEEEIEAEEEFEEGLDDEDFDEANPFDDEDEEGVDF